MDIKEKVEEVSVMDYAEKIKVVYPKDEGKMVNFINYCMLKVSEVMLFPLCSVVFNKEATKYLKSIRPQQPNKNN